MVPPPPKVVNDALLKLGNPGKHSILVFILLCFNYFPVAFNHLLMAIYGATPSHRCKLEDGLLPNESIPMTKSGGLESCQVYVNYSSSTNKTQSCPNGWEYVLEDGDSTIVNEWDLVCERRYLVGLASSIYFVGVMFGGLVFGTLSDKLGRKPIMLITLFLPILFGVMQYFVQNFILFLINRFIIGFLMQGLQLGSVVLMAELFVGHKHRAYTNGVNETFWGSGVMALAGVAYLFKDWRKIQLAISVPSVVCIFFIWVIPESIRWMCSQNRCKEAEKVWRKAAKFNKVALEDDPFQRRLVTSHKPEEDEDTSTKTYTVVDILKTPKLRKRSLIMFYVWLATSLGYYGLSLQASRLASNKYLAFFISGAVEFPIYPAGVFIISKFGRKKPLFIYFIIGGISCICAGTIPKTTGDGSDISWLSTTLAWLGKASMAGCFSVLFLYGAEVYPTVVRNIGVGACAFWARVGSVIAPQINTLGDYTISWLPIVIFGAAAVFGGLATLFLPETLNKKLPDTIEEVERKQTEEDDRPEFKDMNGNANPALELDGHNARL